MKYKLHTGKLPIPIYSIAFAIIVLIGSTFSWFTATDSVANRLQAPQYRLDIPAVDIFEPPAIPPNPGDGPMDKTVGATNKGDLPGFLRLLVLPTIVGLDGQETLPARLGTEVIIEDLNSSDWMDGGDGYFYYLKPLPAGQTTPPLFTKVKLAAQLDVRYENASLNIEIKCEAIGIKKWDYRVGWWNTDTAPSQPPLSTIDQALRGFAI
ncbi:MAG: SipW-dependent-type signal peptide-containing protein [Clostridiales Family XIII bacterium]|jgi:predicted ribosomally synthesized peptide with SipW-like signal peptide|nr:SipW-dependent-type signal peptide-containing protein [Clostridiales Family XIII bacterium]